MMSGEPGWDPLVGESRGAASREARASRGDGSPASAGCPLLLLLRAGPCLRGGPGFNRTWAVQSPGDTSSREGGDGAGGG